MYNAFLLNISKFSLFLNNSSIASATLASLPLGKKVSNLSSTYLTYTSIKIDNLSFSFS